MAKQKQTEEGLDNFLTLIDERIEFLQTLKDAAKFAFGLESVEILNAAEEEAENPRLRKQRTTPARRKKRVVADGTYTPRGTNNELILTVLKAAGTPLSIPEVHSRMKARGWETTSTNPRNLVGSTVRYMAQKGFIKKIGTDFEWMEPSNPLGEAIAEAEAMSR